VFVSVRGSCKGFQYSGVHVLMRTLRLLLVVFLPVAEASDTSWRLGQAMDLPDWLTLAGEHRLRYESLSDQIASGREGSDQILVYRTALAAEARFADATLGLEVMDSRQALADDGSRINTSQVNTLEFIQSYVRVAADDLLVAGDRGELQFGRFTMDLGSRRLVARNRFRNTLNTFTGAKAFWKSPSGTKVTAFHVLPVYRLPGDPQSLLANERENDEETSSLALSGIYLESGHLIPAATVSLYSFYLDERDSVRADTADRNFVTSGVRLSRGPESGEWDFELEAAYQYGTSRASTSDSDTDDLDHRAHFEHLQLGYTFDAEWSPRLIAQFDYASGDKDPCDRENNRFDTLYGARRFDFGPTGIYGAFAHSNVMSPGYRLLMSPSRGVELMLAQRYFWLAASADTWTASGLRDRTGASGDNLGQQLEVSAKWRAVPGTLELELGAAQLWRGNFVEEADGDGVSNPLYGYLQVKISF